MRSITAHQATYEPCLHKLLKPNHPQSVSAHADWAFVFVNINYFFFFSYLLAWQHAPQIKEMRHLHCFLAMKTPTRTPVSNTTPASSHRFRASRVLRAPAAPPFPKTSAKQSCSQEDEKQNEGSVRTTYCWSLSRQLKRKQEQRWQNTVGMILILCLFFFWTHQ